MSKTQEAQVRCLRPGCGHRLTAPSSTKAGYGRTCRRRIRDAARDEALAGFTPVQAQKAGELIEQGGLVPDPGRGWFHAVSSGGDAIYLTSAHGCDCPAARSGRLCYHVAAVRLMDATWQASRPAAFGSLMYAGGQTVDEGYRDEKAGLYDDPPDYEPADDPAAYDALCAAYLPDDEPPF